MVKPLLSPRSSTKKAFSRRQVNIIAIPFIIAAIAVVLSGVLISVRKWQMAVALPAASYQAVFLSNGQTYFGHLKNLNGQYMQLSDVYYLQQSNTATDATAESTSNDTAPQFSIVRLGNEIHQPENVIIINREHVLFWENLKTDSQIITAIQKDKSQ